MLKKVMNTLKWILSGNYYIMNNLENVRSF